MSKIIDIKEAQAIANKLCAAMGFHPPVADFKANEEFGKQLRLCNYKIVKKTIGWWIWKRTIEVQELDPIYQGRSWEEALEGLDQWLSTEGQSRVERADRLRDKYNTLLLDEKLEE